MLLDRRVPQASPIPMLPLTFQSSTAWVYSSSHAPCVRISATRLNKNEKGGLCQVLAHLPVQCPALQPPVTQQKGGFTELLVWVLCAPAANWSTDTATTR